MKYLFFLLICFSSLSIYAQSGYEIKIQITNFQEDSIILSYPYGQDIIGLDTIKKSNDGFFLFKGKDDLKEGVYFIGDKKNKIKFPMIIKPNDDHFEAFFDNKNKYILDFKRSKENKIYRDYFLTVAESKKIQNLYFRTRQSSKHDSILRELNEIRKAFIENNPNTFAAKVIKNEIAWVDPEFSGTSSEILRKKIQYKIDHFIDNIELSDPITIVLPMSHQILVDYFDKVVILKPHLINSKLDSVFNVMGYKSDLFKYYLPFFHKKYSTPFQKWVDDTYIHITNNYYTKEIAPWLSEKTIDYVEYQVKMKSSTLIGKTIPDIVLQTQDDQNIRLLDIEAEYIVLFFWRPGCSRCKYALPSLIDLNERSKNKGVKIISACTRQGSDIENCWEGVKKEKMHDFAYNLADKTGKTGFLRKFNIAGLPMIYILDKDKKIIDKKVAHSLLSHVFEELLKSEK